MSTHKNIKFSDTSVTSVSYLLCLGANHCLTSHSPPPPTFPIGLNYSYFIIATSCNVWNINLGVKHKRVCK